LRLSGLLRNDADIDGPIYQFLYVRGSMKKTGSWMGPSGAGDMA
jgi:hypothetical protein